MNWKLITAAVLTLTNLPPFALFLTPLTQAEANTKAKEVAIAQPYVGADNLEAQFHYHGQVVLEAPQMPTDAQVVHAIESQIKMLPGPLLFSTETVALPMSPKQTHQLSNIRVSASTADSKTYVVEYEYAGTVIVSPDAPHRVPILLALKPAKTYNSSRALIHAGELNPCTDDHYQSQGDFWYFWSPRRPGCQLKEGADYLTVTATLTPISNTQGTAPDYERMINASGIIPISVFMGKDLETSNGNPYLEKKSENSDDASVYLAVVDHLQSQGYIRTTPDISHKPAVSILETYEKPIAAGENNKVSKIRVNLFYGETKYYIPTNVHFHQALKPALEKDAVVIYSGHSGLGRNMNLDYIAKASGTKIKLNPSIYQLIMFESCSSYQYYNEDYFSRKATPNDPRGTHNLDIITNGTESEFLPGADRINTLIDAVTHYALLGAVTTYSEILARFPNAALTGVVGDND